MIFSWSSVKHAASPIYAYYFRGQGKVPAPSSLQISSPYTGMTAIPLTGIEYPFCGNENTQNGNTSEEVASLLLRWKQHLERPFPEVKSAWDVCGAWELDSVKLGRDMEPQIPGLGLGHLKGLPVTGHAREGKTKGPGTQALPPPSSFLHRIISCNSAKAKKWHPTLQLSSVCSPTWKIPSVLAWNINKHQDSIKIVHRRSLWREVSIDNEVR